MCTRHLKITEAVNYLKWDFLIPYCLWRVFCLPRSLDIKWCLLIEAKYTSNIYIYILVESELKPHLPLTDISSMSLYSPCKQQLPLAALVLFSVPVILMLPSLHRVTCLLTGGFIRQLRDRFPSFNIICFSSTLEWLCKSTFLLFCLFFFFFCLSLCFTTMEIYEYIFPILYFDTLSPSPSFAPDWPSLGLSYHFTFFSFLHFWTGLRP